jgi:hypothetical protein
MTDATNTIPGVDPDRAGFGTVLHAARDQVIKAAGVIADTVIDLVGAIGRLVLDNLLPNRRLRINTRTVKRAMSKTPNVEAPRTSTIMPSGRVGARSWTDTGLPAPVKAQDHARAPMAAMILDYCGGQARPNQPPASAYAGRRAPAARLSGGRARRWELSGTARSAVRAVGNAARGSAGGRAQRARQCGRSCPARAAVRAVGNGACG